MFINRIALSVVIVLAMLFTGQPAVATNMWLQDVQPSAVIVRVKTDGLSAGSCGDSWANACSLAYALENATSGQEFWVAAGTYIPQSFPFSIPLQDGVALYGGFAGTETSRAERDWDVNVTILSGESGVVGDITDNVRVVLTSDVDETAVLDGFIISDGTGGIGLWNNASPTLANLIITNNYAESGAGLYNDGGSPILTNIIFDGNIANHTSGYCNYEALGGGMYSSGGNPQLTNVVFQNNQAHTSCEENYSKGGGLYIKSGTPHMTNITFENNSADAGGGLATYAGAYLLNKAAFSNNTAGIGGAIYEEQSYESQLKNITIYGNTADLGGGVYFDSQGGIMELTNVTISGNSATTQGGGMYLREGGMGLYNSIISGNTASVDAQVSMPHNIPHINATLFVDHAIIPSGCPGHAVCDESLIRTDPNLGDFGNYGGFNQTIAILLGSPAIDAGNAARCPAADQRGILRPQGYGCDLGAYESPFAVPQRIYSLGTQDGWVLESSETSKAGGTINAGATTCRLGDDGEKKQYVCILSFNTGGLPNNAIITKLTLKLKKQGVTGGGNPVNTFQGFMVDIKKGIFGTAALQAGDFQVAASKSYGPFKPALVSNWYSINLTAGKNYINKLSTASGLTQIRLRFKLDDNNNAIANYLSVYSGNAGAASRPQLVIEYHE